MRLPSFCVAGVALAALGWLWWRAWARLVAGDAAVSCMAGKALGDIHLRVTWQAWTSTSSIHVAGVALGDIYLRFAWRVWHLVRSTLALRGRRGTCGAVARLVAGDAVAWQAWHLATSTFVARGRRGTWCLSITSPGWCM